MAATTQTLARPTTGIRPFRVEIPEEDLKSLRARIAATRWPEKQTVDDQSQGVPLETNHALARYLFAGQCFALQGGVKARAGGPYGPERVLTRPVLLFDVVAQDGQGCAVDGPGELRVDHSRLAW